MDKFDGSIALVQDGPLTEAVVFYSGEEYGGSWIISEACRAIVIDEVGVCRILWGL